MKENAKLHIVVIENGDLKKMVANLEDELHECKKASLTNEHLNKIQLKEVLKK